MSKPALQSRTLFFDASSGAAVLVTNRDGKRSRRALRFSDPHAALDYCLARFIAFVLVPAANPKSN